VQPAGDVEQFLAGRFFELLPSLVRAAQQRDVIRMLVIRHPNHARKSERAAARVGDVELLQPQHAHAAARQFPARRSAHGADSNHDDIEAVLHNLSKATPIVYHESTSTYSTKSAEPLRPKSILLLRRTQKLVVAN